MSIPAVTVLMTAFNRERYIADAIESVLTQTYRDFELIVVDDASTDRTVPIARDYERRDARVRVVVNGRNLGDYANRNRAAALVETEFFKYHDSDDLMYPTCLDVMVSALSAEPRADFALTTSKPWAGGPVPMLLSPAMCYEREYLGQGLFHLGPACALFRRTSFERLGPFALRGTVSDYHFWLRACRDAHVLLVQGDLFWYRVHEGQSMQSPVAAREQLETERTAWEALFEPSCPLRGAQLEQARSNRLSGVVRRALLDAWNGDVGRGVARLRCVGASPRQWLKYLGGRQIDLTAGTPARHAQADATER